MKPFFKPEQFEDIKPIEFNKYQVAERANALLQERGVRVYGRPNNNWNSTQCTTTRTYAGDTHQALLVCIEELPKKECEHEPDPRKTEESMSGFRYFCKCGVRLKAKWEVAE